MLVLSLFAAVPGANFCQDFAGFRTGNYTGVNGIFFNPSGIADSRFRYDLNLVSISSSLGNNKASFNINDFNTTFDEEKLIDQLIGNSKGNISGALHLDIHGPSLMFNTGKKMAFALSTRARSIINIVDFDAPLIRQIADDADKDTQFPYSFSSNANMRFSANAWTEIGLTVARVLASNGPNFFKGGLTLKWLSGAGNAHLNIANFKGTLYSDPNADVYLANASGSLSAGFGGIELSNIEGNQFLKFSNTGVGADLGFTYEYRPGFTGSDHQTGSLQALNKYKFKVALSILDIGGLTYQKDMQRSGAYNVDISGSERFYLSELDNTTLDSFNYIFKSRPQFFTPAASNSESSYRVSSPTTIFVDADYNVTGGMYTSLALQLALPGTKVFNSRYYTGFTVTPRYEGKGFGFYLPVNYSSLTSFNAGLSFRFGPIFFGSGTVLSALLGNSKQADIHFGLHIAGLK